MIVPVRSLLTVHAVDLNDEGSLALCLKRVDLENRLRRWVPYTCSACIETLRRPRYGFCEAVTASGTSPIHIRVLSGRGLQTSGSADTPALCGRPVAWDIPGVVNRATAAGDPRTCPSCLPIWREATAPDS